MTAVPGAIDVLIRMARMAPLIGGAGVRVDDGPWMSPPEEQELLVIGWVPIEGPTVSWAEDLVTLAGQRQQSETFDVHNLMRVWRPDSDLKPARDRIVEIFDAFRDLVAADRTLTGVVDQCRLVTKHLTSSKGTSGGSKIELDFAVQCQVF